MYPENPIDTCGSSSGSWRMEKLDSESSDDFDDGYDKSESSSYHSANETVVDSKSTASSTSGLASNSSSLSKESENASIQVSNLCEIVKKISISQDVNDAIFKPDFRLSLKRHDPPKYWAKQNLLEINFLEEHTKESCETEDVNNEVISKLIRAYSKLFVQITLEKCNTSNDYPMIKIHIRNSYSRQSIILLHLLWINLYNHQIVAMKSLPHPINLPKFESTDIYVSAKDFELGKNYKLVFYYSPLDLLFSKEFTLKLTTRPVSTMYLEKLEHFFPAPEIRKLDRCHYKVPKEGELLEELQTLKERIVRYEKSEAASRLTSANYYSMCKLLLQMEDETDSKRSLRHDQFQQRVKHEFGNRYSLPINNKRLEAAINEYTRIWITPMSIRTTEQKFNEIQAQQRKPMTKSNNQRSSIPRNKKERIYGSVIEIRGNTIYLELNESLHKFIEKTNVHPANEEYFIRFMSDRTTITLEHRALEYLNNQNISHFFFPIDFAAGISTINKSHPSSYTNQIIEWNSDDINDEQKSAVINILRQTSYPYPYLLFGPPGTGKTKTLIEAILQIIQNNNPNEYILVCATSNAACNEVAKRLLANIGSNKLFRIFSKSVAMKMSDIPSNVLGASNLQTGEHYYPSLQIIYQFKVIVCTLTTAGRLSQGKINPKHFSHVFIDEAGSATESQTLIALAGLCTAQNEIHANVIFAGDPKQLGPLIKSQQAVKMGYGVSMLERLITTNSLYMRNEQTKQFNQNYVTQLICNYRSHASILHPSNDLYYDNALRVCAPKANTDWFIGSSLLKNAQFPVLFHSVKGVTARDHSNPSSYNLLEVDVTMDYLRRIFKLSERVISQNDIGIISPYRRQCEQLVEKCASNGYHNIQIGSVEVYQGQEKPIIICSTVRSQMDNVGFLNSKKRLNVLLTRAKCLLIIIGDADTLAKDEDWNYVIKFCKENNSLIEGAGKPINGTVS